MIDVISTEAN